MGIDDFMSYNLLWNDFKAYRNWGQRENGDFVLVDEGAFNADVTSTSKVQDWSKKEWEEIKQDRRRLKRAIAIGRPPSEGAVPAAKIAKKKLAKKKLAKAAKKKVRFLLPRLEEMTTLI